MTEQEFVRFLETLNRVLLILCVFLSALCFGLFVYLLATGGFTAH